MTLIKITNGDIITIYDSDTSQTVFDGTKNIQIPTPVFVGTIADAQNKVANDTDYLATAQNNLSRSQTIIDTINSAIPPVV